MKNFRSLKVWQKSHQLTLSIYKATSAFPKEELYGLTSQLRRGSVSIAANMQKAVDATETLISPDSYRCPWDLRAKLSISSS